MVLTAPHGGATAPLCVPDRDAEDNSDLGRDLRGTKFVTMNDHLSLDLAQDLAVALEKVGLQPHLVANSLRRIKLDVNRAEIEACSRGSKAVRAYRCVPKRYETCFESESKKW